MGTALTGNSGSSTYDSLLKATDNGPLTASLKVITDGLGNDSALQLSTAAVKSSGTLEVTGASTFTGAVTLTGGLNTPLVGAQGGTGVANTGKTITLGGNLTTSGANAVTLTTSGATNVTLPTTGTLATLAGSETLSNKTLTTPVLGVATATSVNKVAITAPATSATLTVADGKTLAASNSLTLAGTDGTTITFQGTDTYVGRATTDTLTNKTLTSPTLTTPALGVATATSINKVAITAPAASATLTIADGKTLTANASLTLTGTDSTTMTFPAASGTVLTADSTATLTNKTLTSPTINGGTITGITDITVADGGTGASTAVLARAALNKGETALSDGATIATDAAAGNVFTVTLGGNRTMGAPTNLAAGATYIWRISQDATGSRTLSWNAVFKFPSGVDPTLTTTASAVDIISGVSDGTNIYCSYILDVK